MLLGRRATLFQAGPKEDWITVIPVQDATFVDIQGALGSEAAYRTMLAEIRTVDVDTWLMAMPASAVKPDERARVVADIFQDIPVPQGFDRNAFAKGDVDSRYNLGAAITGQVTCAWLDQWSKGDVAAKKQAKDALATAHSWKIFKEMEPIGAWPRVVWEITDAFVQHARIEPEFKQSLDC